MNLKELFTLPEFMSTVLETARRHNATKNETGFALLVNSDTNTWQLTDIIEGSECCINPSSEYERIGLDKLYNSLQIHFHPTKSTLGKEYSDHIIPSGGNGDKWGHVKGDLQFLKSRAKYGKPNPIEIVSGYNPNENGHEIVRMIAIQENKNPYTNLCPAYESFIEEVTLNLQLLNKALKDELDTEMAQKKVVDHLLNIEMKTFEVTYSPFYKVAYLKSIDGIEPVQQYGTDVENLIVL